MHHALLTIDVLRSANAAGRGRLDGTHRARRAQDFRWLMAALREVVGPVLALLTEETCLRHSTTS
ncbi:MAG: hypothetical protein WCG26_01930 [Chloroflexales bacterium]